jgi:hypothetical protein
LLLACAALLTIPQIPAVSAAPSPNSVSAYGCNYTYFVGRTEGAYPASGGVFVEYDIAPVEMFLSYCSSAGITEVASPPSGAPAAGYSSMGGVSTSIGTVLVLDSASTASPGPGFWFCEAVTTTHCGIESTYITLPSGFCSAQTAGRCDPQGIALDKKLNVYYADPLNAEVVECTLSSGYQTCTVKESLSGKPTELFRASNGDLWVTDASCAGNVWKNGAVQYTMDDQVEGITMSNANPSKTSHLYFAVTAACGFYSFGFVIDASDSTILTPLGSPFSGPAQIPFITTKLQFTTNTTETVYQIKDTT